MRQSKNMSPPIEVPEYEGLQECLFYSTPLHQPLCR